VRAALALIALAACGGDEPGMRLEILAGKTGAVSIELYLGTRPCEGCDGKIAPKNVGEKLAGEVWYLDGSAAAGTPATAATLEDGRYVYDLRTPDPDKDARLAHVLVVGYDGQGRVVGVGTLTDAPLYHAATEWYRLTLGPATDAPSSDEVLPEGERVYVWDRFDKTLASCVGYETAADDGVKRLWFVPEDDTDCDAIDLDCDLYAYHAVGKVDIADASCLTEAYSVPNTSGKTCLLGGPACIDGAGRMPTCGPVTPSHCLPDAICANATCAVDLPLCLRDAQVGAVPRIRCDIPYNAGQNGAPCLSTNQRHDSIDLSYLLSSTTCKSILFADTKLGQINVTNRITTAAGLEIKPDQLEPPCQFGMTWTSGNAGTLANAPIVRMTVVELHNGNRMLIPIEIQYHPTGCEMADVMTCDVTVAPTDGIAHCAQMP
jgi:hypothetical protein